MESCRENLKEFFIGRQPTQQSWRLLKAKLPQQAGARVEVWAAKPVVMKSLGPDVGLEDFTHRLHHAVYDGAITQVLVRPFHPAFLLQAPESLLISREDMCVQRLEQVCAARR